MFGDYLKEHIYELSNASSKKTDENAFWNILKQIAINDIIECGAKVDSDIATELYYNILRENEGKIPSYFTERLPSNGQPRYRVINRNLFSSNAYHPDGLANQSNILAKKQINEYRKGFRIVYEGVNEKC